MSCCRKKAALEDCVEVDDGLEISLARADGKGLLESTEMEGVLNFSSFA